MKDEELVSAVTNSLYDTIHAGEYATWEDLCVEIHVSNAQKPFDGIVIWGKTDDSGKNFFSISLRKGFGKDDPGTEIAKTFSETASLKDLETCLTDFLTSKEAQHEANSISDKEEPLNRFLRINGQEFSFDDVAKALGMEVSPHVQPVQVELCQRVDSGVLVAKGAYFDQDDYPGIDVELHLPAEKDSIPIIVSRTEQPQPDGEDHALRTFGYDRNNEYFMYFDTDLRPDAQVYEQMLRPSLTVAGNPGLDVDVMADNPYVNYKGYSSLVSQKEGLDSKIHAASSRSLQDQSYSDKSEKHGKTFR